MTMKKKVLVIDDEEMHLYTAKGLLEGQGVEVVTHQGGFGATNRIIEVRPDLVLVDVNMPALSGGSLATLIEPICRELGVPVYFYSSNDEASLRELAAAHRVQGYVCKGDIAALYGTVNGCRSGR